MRLNLTMTSSTQDWKEGAPISRFARRTVVYLVRRAKSMVAGGLKPLSEKKGGASRKVFGKGPTMLRLYVSIITHHHCITKHYIYVALFQNVIFIIPRRVPKPPTIAPVSSPNHHCFDHRRPTKRKWRKLIFFQGKVPVGTSFSYTPPPVIKIYKMQMTNVLISYGMRIAKIPPPSCECLTWYIAPT